MDSFRDPRCFPEIKDLNDEREFKETIKAIKVRDINVVATTDLDEPSAVEESYGIQRLLIKMLMKKVMREFNLLFLPASQLSHLEFNTSTGKGSI